MKIIISSFCLFCFTYLQSQNLYVKSVTEQSGVPEMIARLTRAKSEQWITANNSKKETQVMSSTQTEYQSKEGVVLINTNEPKCVVISNTELAEDSVLNNVLIANLTIAKTDESEKILGKECKKTVLSYKVANRIQPNLFMNCVMTLWVCESLNSAALLQNDWRYIKMNALDKALQNIKGIVLKSETLVKENNMVSTTKVVEMNEKPIADDVFQVNMKFCKKSMNLKTYNEHLEFENRKATGWH